MRAQRFDRVAHLAEVAAIWDPAGFRVSLAIAADVGQAVALIRIRPPVGRQAHVVVFVAAGWRRVFVHYGVRAIVERSIGVAPKAIEGRIKLRAAAAKLLSHLL